MIHKPTNILVAGAGFCNSRGHTIHPKSQILAIEDLLSVKNIDMPGWPTIQTSRKAPKVKAPATSGRSLTW